MKLDDSTRFPHPILWSVTGDFSAGTFSASEIRVEEDLISGSVTLQVRLDISHPDFLKLIRTGKAQPGVIVECSETFFSQLYRLPSTGGPVALEPGAVSGRVSIRPAIWTKLPIEDFAPRDLHSEFSIESIAMEPGALIAIADEQIIEVGRQKLAPIETIFALSLDEQVPPGEYRADVESECITIRAAAKAHEDISGMRNGGDGRSVLLCAVYLPVLMSVIECMQDGDSEMEGRRWYKVLTAKANALGIELTSCEPLEAAQMLLKAPFSNTAAACHRMQQ